MFLDYLILIVTINLCGTNLRVAKHERHVFVSADFCSIDLSVYGIISHSLDISYNIPKVDFYNMKGLSLNLKSHLFVFPEGITDFHFQNSRFDIFDEENFLIEADRCSTDYFANKDIHYFGNMMNVQIWIHMNTNHLKRPICPYLFKNAIIEMMVFASYGDDYLFQNYPRFYEIRNENNLTVALNSIILSLHFKGINRYRFTQESINSYLFSDVALFSIEGIFGHIEEDFFKVFNRVHDVEFQIENFGGFFQSSNNEWLSFLFFKLEQVQSREEMINFIQRAESSFFGVFRLTQKVVNTYDFPDEDFCLFKHFPRFKPIITFYQHKHFSESFIYDFGQVSCTARYLAQNNVLLLDKLATLGYELAAFSPNKSILTECNFEQRLSLCMNASNSIKYSQLKTRIYYLDVIYAFDWIEFIGPIITFPIFSSVAFVLNLIVILILRNKKNSKEKLFEAKSFVYIEINSVFNCVECLIYQTRLIGICLGANSVFCSSIRDTSFVVYFEMVCRYVSEVMKSCSMLTGLLFSVQRYVEASKTKKKRLLWFNQLETRRIIMLVLIYGLVTSVPVFFSFEQYSHIFDYDVPSPFALRIESFMILKVKIETYFHFARFFMNDFVILAINLVVDCCLVSVIKKNLRQKEKNVLKMNEKNPSELSPLEEKKLKEENKKKASIERKANAMIIINIIIYTFCRLPELLSAFFLFYFSQIGLGACLQSISCFLVSNFIEYMYMLSYLFNIFLYYHFNTFFNKGFFNFFNISKSKASA